MWESIRPAHECVTAQTVLSVDVKASFQAFPQARRSSVPAKQSWFGFPLKQQCVYGEAAMPWCRPLLKAQVRLPWNLSSLDSVVRAVVIDVAV